MPNLAGAEDGEIAFLLHIVRLWLAASDPHRYLVIWGS
jgi:hypothetical protein